MRSILVIYSKTYLSSARNMKFTEGTIKLTPESRDPSDHSDRIQKITSEARAFKSRKFISTSSIIKYMDG